MSPDALKWVSNHERTRWFLVLQVVRPTAEVLNRLLALSNRALAAFDQPSLYAPSRDVRRNAARVVDDLAGSVRDYSACFHVSLAWSLAAPSRAEEERVEGLELGAVKGMRVRFDSVKVKIGNHVESIALRGEI